MDTYEPLLCDIIKEYNKPFKLFIFNIRYGVTDEYRIFNDFDTAADALNNFYSDPPDTRAVATIRVTEIGEKSTDDIIVYRNVGDVWQDMCYCTRIVCSFDKYKQLQKSKDKEYDMSNDLFLSSIIQKVKDADKKYDMGRCACRTVNFVGECRRGT